MKEEYIPFEWPDYQTFMEKSWFEFETYYDLSKDVYLIPKKYLEEIDN